MFVVAGLCKVVPMRKLQGKCTAVSFGGRYLQTLGAVVLIAVAVLYDARIDTD